MNIKSDDEKDKVSVEEPAEEKLSPTRIKVESMEIKMTQLMSDKKSDGLVTFKKPYEFEGTFYSEVDLSGIEDISGARLSQIEKIFYKMGNTPTVVEMNMEYAMIIAHHVTPYPLAFFEGLPAKEAVKIKYVVSDFLLD